MRLLEVLEGVLRLPQTSSSKPGLVLTYLKSLIGFLKNSDAGNSQETTTQGQDTENTLLVNRLFTSLDLPPSMRIRELDVNENLMVMQSINQKLLEGNLKKAGPGRHEDWEQGWEENLRLLQDAQTHSNETDLDSAISPRYFGKNHFERIGGNLIGVNPGESAEVRLLRILVDSLLGQAIIDFDVDEVWEFGCGTGHHLLRQLRNFPNIHFRGLDWAKSSQDVLREMSYLRDLSKLSWSNFDYFSPNFSIRPRGKAIFYTVASLEQVGKQFLAFLDYCMDVRPKLIMHIEPVEELLGDSELEVLSKRYFKERNYLSGFLAELARREAEGKLEILGAMRNGLGSLYIEGYSVIFWRPITP